MLKLIRYILLTTYTTYVTYASTFNLVGRVVNCKTNIDVSCTTLFLPTGYFAIKSKCFNDILRKSTGIDILFQGVSMNIKFIIKDELVTYIYPIHNRANTTDYYWNDKHVSFSEDDYRNDINYTLYGYLNDTTIEFNYDKPTQHTQLFSYYSTQDQIIFNEFNVFPKSHKIIDVDYRDPSSCKKNNILMYDPDLYDDVCHII